MTNVDWDRNQARRDVLSNQEFEAMLNVAKEHQFPFTSMRNVALLCMLRLTGKRRGELDQLPIDDVWVRDGFLRIRFNLLKKRRPMMATKSIVVTDSYALAIVEYGGFLRYTYPNAEYFFPSTRFVYGQTYVVLPKIGLKDRQIYNIVRETGDKAGVIAWPHLFRETAGAEEVKKSGNDITSIYKVMARIDVTEQTAWNYVRRYALSVIEREQ